MAYRGYVGDYGGGKTYSMIEDAWRAHQKGRPVYANIGLVDLRARRALLTGWEAVCWDTFGLYWAGLVRTWEEVCRLDNAVVLIDEIGRFGFGSTSWEKVSKNRNITGFLHQQRKFGVDVWYTSQLNSMVHNQIRDLTPETVICTRRGALISNEIRDLRLTGAGAKTGGVRKLRRIRPHVFSLYNTLEVVGDGETGEGYQVGNSQRYAHLSEGQRAVLIRKFGPERVGLVREERPLYAQDGHPAEYPAVCWSLKGA